MTESEKKMLKATVLAVDHIFEGLAIGYGIFDWESSREKWYEQTKEVREALDRAPDKRSPDDE